MARLVCMTNYVPKEKPPLYETLKTTDPKLQKEFKKMRIKELKYNKYQVKELGDNDHQCTCKLQGPNNNHTGGQQPELSPDMSPLHLYQNLETDVKEIRRIIKTLLYKQKAEEGLDKIRGEWRAVALVLDRGFFFLYVLSIIVSLATMFPRGA